MEDLTPEQIVSVAEDYRSVALALSEFQVNNWPALTIEQHLDLNAYQSSLLNRAQDLQTLAVRPAFERAADMVATIRQATDDARLGLKQIRNLTVALNVGAITVALASYVARANLRGIQTSLREMTELLLMNREQE